MSCSIWKRIESNRNVTKPFFNHSNTHPVFVCSRCAEHIGTFSLELNRIKSNVIATLEIFDGAKIILYFGVSMLFSTTMTKIFKYIVIIVKIWFYQKLLLKGHQFHITKKETKFNFISVFAQVRRFFSYWNWPIVKIE